MHKSKLAGFIVDFQTDDLDGAAGFWSGALGLAIHEPANASELDAYRHLDGRGLGLHVEVQRRSGGAPLGSAGRDAGAADQVLVGDECTDWATFLCGAGSV